MINFFGLGWVRVIIGAVAIVVYSWFIYNQGWNAEHLNHLKTINKYTSETVEAERRSKELLQQNINTFAEASKKYQVEVKQINTLAKEIHTETVKEIDRPIYKECVVSDAYFESIQQKIKELNK